MGDGGVAALDLRKVKVKCRRQSWWRVAVAPGEWAGTQSTTRFHVGNSTRLQDMGWARDRQRTDQVKSTLLVSRKDSRILRNVARWTILYCTVPTVHWHNLTGTSPSSCTNLSIMIPCREVNIRYTISDSSLTIVLTLTAEQPSSRTPFRKQSHRTASPTLPPGHDRQQRANLD